LLGCGKKEQDEGEDAKKAVKQTEKTWAKEGLVQLDGAAQKRAGILTEGLAARRITPEIVAYGHLEEDPSTTFVLRAPVAGTLEGTTGHAWPRIGEHLETGAVIGTIEPRFTPSERIGMNTQLTAARSDLASATASVPAAQAAYERARKLNADNKNVADRIVQEAEAQLRTEQARAKSASETVQALEGSLGSAGVAASRPLKADRAGDVVEILAQPGEVIEPGSPILRLTRLDLLLARVDVPVGDRVAPNLLRARIVPAGYEDQPPFNAERIAVSGAVDPRAQGIPLLFRVSGTRFGLRPGLAVTAYLPAATSAGSGLIIRQASIVRMGGRSYVYVQVGPTKFERRPVSLDQLTTGGYAVGSGFTAGDRVVMVGAQSLLSEEFKSQMTTDEQ
ncbi:MAG: efflux RND transporter periplasmic adaptor subunit, partial [Bryobacteraceae bacterium]